MVRVCPRFFCAFLALGLLPEKHAQLATTSLTGLAERCLNGSLFRSLVSRHGAEMGGLQTGALFLLTPSPRHPLASPQPPRPSPAPCASRGQQLQHPWGTSGRAKLQAPQTCRLGTCIGQDPAGDPCAHAGHPPGDTLGPACSEGSLDVDLWGCFHFHIATIARGINRLDSTPLPQAKTR